MRAGETIRTVDAMRAEGVDESVVRAILEWGPKYSGLRDLINMWEQFPDERTGCLSDIVGAIGDIERGDMDGDPDLCAAIRAAERDIAAGRVVPDAVVRRELRQRVANLFSNGEVGSLEDGDRRMMAANGATRLHELLVDRLPMQIGQFDTWMSFEPPEADEDCRVWFIVEVIDRARTWDGDMEGNSLLYADSEPGSPGVQLGFYGFKERHTDVEVACARVIEWANWASLWRPDAQ